MTHPDIVLNEDTDKNYAYHLAIYDGDIQKVKYLESLGYVEYHAVINAMMTISDKRKTK